MATIFVTGGTGFVGNHLVRALLERGDRVRCLARDVGRGDGVRRAGAELVIGRITDAETIRAAVADAAQVYHLAGLTKTYDHGDFHRVNGEGTRQLAAACAAAAHPPTLVYISSLAATGPAIEGRAVNETDQPRPVSDYGRSKLAGEELAAQYADRVPMTFLRPPMVLGPGDRTSLELFKSIARMHVYPVPGRGYGRYSWVDVRDLVTAMLLVAERGERVRSGSIGSGVYHVNNVDDWTYRELGQRIAAALGGKWYLPLAVWPPFIRMTATIGEKTARAAGREIPYLNRDKASEATAPAWFSNGDKLRALGFTPAADPDTRLRTTGEWYREHGWL